MLVRREFLYVLWAGALTAFIAGIVAITYWYVRPHARAVSVANVLDLEAGSPILRDVGGDLVVYLVRINGEIRAWDAASPLSRCRLIWVGFNQRFEDPCSGAKWCIDGSIADRRFRDATTLVGYETNLSSDGQVLVNSLKAIAGQPLSPDEWVADRRAVQEATVNCGRP